MRDVGEADGEAVSRLLAGAGYDSTPERAAESIALFRDHPGSHCFAAVDGERIVGFLALVSYPMFHSHTRSARIAALAVATTHRGRNVGRELVTAAESFARAMGCDRIEVTANIEREEQHPFYERLGYDGNSRRFVRLLS